MKRYEDSKLYKEMQKEIVNTRVIDPREWDKFNERMYEVKKELRAKEISSQKSARNVWVKYSG